ncbi:APC family permease [Ruminiclostridium cellobioparum]|uniref:Amino acid transporter n=1 Tax=Ruminiclostridium cellobioparum subsp. termitidis CT1112 TaxID=1195236 RepID=S0FLD6_RUMCE|nr:APC family permease [Ruminiclostridium cellobioparum]EMS71126.1 amino acid transporter [Ruminiclostridium cellobioparum subsp. termitidis CT1112]
MYKKIRRVLVGRPLKNEALNDQKMGVLWGLPILSSDAISSVAYAGQEVLMVLIPVIGLGAYRQMSFISVSIICLLMLLMLSYRQIIDSYPNGGGAFVVAKENLGIHAGVTAGAALAVDYILTVAVSISSGVEQFTTAFKEFKPYSVLIACALVVLLMIGNLRGIRESSRIFGIPAYLFIFGIVIMIVWGIINIKRGYVPPPPKNMPAVVEPLSIILILRAFSNGCTALTGVEAVSNAVPNFKNPSKKYAKRVLFLLSMIILILFGGSSVLANLYKVNPQGNAMLVLIAEEIFGHGFMFYYITATTFIILVMAANTAYSGFPMLISLMAKEGYAPRQLSMRGDRLSYDNGIILLSIVASILMIIFKAKVTSLLGLYAIGVFISFTLAQTGMFVKWKNSQEKGWKYKAVINGIGAVVTAIVVVIIAFTKFEEGAWLVVILIPVLIFMVFKVKKHYNAVMRQLRLKPEEIAEFDINKAVYTNRVIVPIESINRSSLRALRYARTISENVVAFSVAIDDESAKKIKEKYDALNIDIPLITKYSPFRRVVDPLLKFIESAEYDYQNGDMITVILPQFAVKKWWHKILHNNTRYYIERELLKHKHIVVSVMPLQLRDDDFVLNNPKYD